MKIHKLKNFTRGWVAGDFERSILRSKDFEFAVQYLKAGEKHPKHMHKIAREITVIVSGEFTLNGRALKAGEVMDILPGEPAEFVCVTDGAIAVIKSPSIIGDKYLIT